MRQLIRKAKRGFTLIELMIVVAIIGVLAALGIYGVRAYIANAKTAEARANVGQIGKNAVAAYNRESMAGAVLAQGTSTSTLNALCKGAGATVPSAIASVQGKKYQSSPANWTADETAADNIGGTSGAGFYCLRFAMDSPQYYMYNYTNTSGAAGSFAGIANGDLDGNGTLSTFTINGAVQNGVANVAPAIVEQNPLE